MIGTPDDRLTIGVVAGSVRETAPRPFVCRGMLRREATILPECPNLSPEVALPRHQEDDGGSPVAASRCMPSFWSLAHSAMAESEAPWKTNLES